MRFRAGGSNLLSLVLLVASCSIFASAKVAAQTCTSSLSDTNLIVNSGFSGNANNWSPLVAKANPTPPGWLYNGNLSQGNLKHQSPDTTVLHGALSAAPIAGKTYQVTFKLQTMSGGAGTITPNLGGTPGTAITAMSSTTVTVQQTIAVTGSPSTDFSLTPSSTFLGFIDEVYVQEVVSFTYPGTSAPCYPDAASAFPAMWPDQNMTSGVINFQTGTPAAFTNFMLNQLQHEPHTFLFNDPNTATSYLYYRPDLRRNNPALTANPYAVMVLKLVDNATKGNLGQLSLAKQSAADFAATGFQLNSFVNTPADNSTTAQRHFGYLNVFYKNARNFAGMCGSDPSKCYVACFDPCHNFTKLAGDPTAPNSCVDAATDAKMCPTSPTYDASFQWIGKQYAPWLSESYLTTLKSLTKIVRTLAYVVGPSTQVNIPSCEDPTVDCDATKLSQYTQISAKASVSNHQLTNLEWIGSLPQLSDAALKVNLVTGLPTWLFVLRQNDPLNGGPISAVKGTYPTYPDATHTVSTLAFATQSNGDQLLTSITDGGSFRPNYSLYDPSISDPSCANNSANNGDFGSEASRCHPQSQKTFDTYPSGAYTGYPRRTEKSYASGAAYSSKSPDRPYAVSTFKLDPSCNRASGGTLQACSSQLDTVERFAYGSADPSSYYRTCKATYAGGVADSINVNVSTDTLPMPAHGLRTGDRVQVYNPTDYNTLGGLTQNGWYYAIRVDDNNLRLASSAANAAANVAVDITSARGCLSYINGFSPTGACGPIFVDAYRQRTYSGYYGTYSDGQDRLIKHLDYFTSGGAVSQSYDYVYEYDAAAQPCMGVPLTEGLAINSSSSGVFNGGSFTLELGAPKNTGALLMYLACNGASCVSSTGQNLCNYYHDIPLERRSMRVTCTNTTGASQQIVPNFYYKDPTRFYWYGMTSLIWSDPSNVSIAK